MSRSFVRRIAVLAALAVPCAAAHGSAPWPRVALNRVAGGFSNPTQVTEAAPATP